MPIDPTPNLGLNRFLPGEGGIAALLNENSDTIDEFASPSAGYLINVNEPVPQVWLRPDGDDSFDGRWDRPLLTPQAAINKFAAAVPGIIRVRGQFTLSSGLIVNQDGLQIVGDSFDHLNLDSKAITKFIAGGAFDVLTIQKGRRAYLRDVMIDGASTGLNGIVLQNAADLIIEHAGAMHCLQFGGIIDGSSTCNGVRLLDAIFYQNGGSGFRSRWASNTSGNNMEVVGGRFTGNGTTFSDASITSGAAVLTTSGAHFASWMQGLPITVIGAGPSGGNLHSLIVSVDSSTQVTLADNAGTTVSTTARWSIGDGLTYANVSLRVLRGWYPSNKNEAIAFGDYVSGVARKAIGPQAIGPLCEANLDNHLNQTAEGGFCDAYAIRGLYLPSDSGDQGATLRSDSSSMVMVVDSNAPGSLRIFGRGRRGVAISGSGVTGVIQALGLNDTDVDLVLNAQGAGKVKIAGALPIDVQVFNAVSSPGSAVQDSFTWTKPTGQFTRVRIVAIGAGGGGGSGGSVAASTACSGGGGGGSGALSSVELPIGSLSATEAVKVGVAGSGGAGVSNAAGNAGNAGGLSQFRATQPIILARAGSGGGAGQNSGVAGPAGAAGTGGTKDGVAGAASSASGGAGTLGSTGFAGSGGSGGGVTAASPGATSAGGAGGASIQVGSGGAGSAGSGSGGGNGGTGTDSGASDPLGGRGGGGGGSDSAASQNGGTGGNGAKYGAGGGGGGACRAAGTSGAGGSGADGIVVVVTY